MQSSKPFSWFFIPAIICTLALTGCISAPEFPRRVSVSEVVANARCELQQAIREKIPAHPWLDRWSAGFQFSFVVERNLNASTDTTFLVPVHHGTFTFGFKANLKQNARGTYGLNFKILKGLGNFADVPCSGSLTHASSPPRLLNGEIGLHRWLSEVIPQIEQSRLQNATPTENAAYFAERKKSGEIENFAYTIEFVITADGSLAPSWSLLFPSGRQSRPGFNVLGSEAETHKLFVQFTPIVAPPVDHTEIEDIVEGKSVVVAKRVCVMNDENMRPCTIAGARLAEAQARRRLETALRAETEAKNLLNQAKNAVPEAIKKQVDPTGKNLFSSHALQNFQLNLPAATPNPAIAGRIAEIRSMEQEVGSAASRRQAAADALEAIRLQSAQLRSSVSRSSYRSGVASEYETARRLDQILQQQLIRDAFRPAN